jgi:hypothetical protein
MLDRGWPRVNIKAVLAAAPATIPISAGRPRIVSFCFKKNS